MAGLAYRGPAGEYGEVEGGGNLVSHTNGDVRETSACCLRLEDRSLPCVPRCVQWKNTQRRQREQVNFRV